MKIIYFYNEEWEKNFVTKLLPEDKFDFYQGNIENNSDVKDEEAEALSIFVDSKLDAENFAKFSKLKLVVTRSTGFDHIDLAEATKRGISVYNVPTYGENTVAEQAFALILTLSRKIYDSYKRIEQDGNFSTAGLKGFDLKGKTLGVIGTGHIGVHSVKIAKGFEMNVIAYDKFPNEKLTVELGFKYIGLDDLLAGSDIITLHAPYNPETHHMINLNNIVKIKKGAYLINTARGGLIDTTAIVKALKDGILAGAGLDVLEEEGYMVDEMRLLAQEHPEAESLRTMLENHYLIDHPCVIITPHNAFNTQEAMERIVTTTVENIKNFEKGDKTNLVTKTF